MATAGAPASPFVHQSFVSIAQHRNRHPQSRPATPGSIGTSISTTTSVTATSSMHSSSPSSSSPTSVTLEPGPNQSYADFVKTWQDAHILRWLTENRCGHHAQAFKDNDIRGDIILELDMDTLKEIGIVSLGDRTRIKSAIAQLRKLCAGGAINNGLVSHGPRVMVNGSAADLRYSRTTGFKLMDDSTNQNLSQENSIADAGASASIRNSRGRPPPLQIDHVREKDLPQIQRIDSARSAATPTPRPTLPTSSNVRVPPKGPIPPTPQPSGSYSRSTPRLTVPSTTPTSGPRSRTPTSESSHLPPFTNDPLPAPPSASPASSWSHSTMGLPRNPADRNLAGGSFARATSPLPIGPSQAQSRIRAIGVSQSHQRQGSGTSNSSGSRGHGNSGSGSTHPYSSPNASLAPVAIGSHLLSPVNESFGSSNTSNAPSYGYSVGRGPFARGNQASQREDDIRRKLMKFHIGASHAKTLEVKDLEDGTELLERALRKFGIQIDEDSQAEMDDILSVGGWAIYLGPDPDAPPLSENELIAIFQAPEHTGRENLHLRQLSQSKRANKLERIFGETPPLTGGPASPIEESMNALTANNRAYKKANRASTVSVLSGLGAIPVGSPPTSPGGSTKPSSAASASFGKLRNFFGQRPPSELITNYLPEYFPFADKKILKKTARHSMMRQSMKPGSAGLIGWGTQAAKNTSRFSTSTMASAKSGRNSALGGTLVQPPSPGASQEEKQQGVFALPVPRVSVELHDDKSMHLTLVDEEETAAGHTPKDERESFLDDMSPETNKSQRLAAEDALTGKAAKRTSKITELKPAGFVSPAAENLVTVDNVTSGIELRRNRDSIVPPAVAEAVQKRESLQPKEVPVDEAEADEDEEDEEDEGEEDEEEEEDENEDEEDEEEDKRDKVTSNAGNRTIKWIRGALIGSGSFGNVYLAMDAQRGLLMAVKQVQLKSSSHSQERMRSMLAALEREIELLKTLQHENIVQYLDSAIDENHLNIFLEYVPGGSVASLLRNYGAFEEALTKNWVKQILCGLEYLHSQTIIHRDIKGANILVDNKGGIKISDFGISKKVEEGLPRGNNRMSLQGSVFWMAPEVVKQIDYTSKADIWSVGCLIIEMLTSQHPFPEFTQMQAIYKLGFGGAKPAIPTDITPEAIDFLQKTFELDHTARPSAAELLDHLWLKDA